MQNRRDAYDDRESFEQGTLSSVCILSPGVTFDSCLDELVHPSRVRSGLVPTPEDVAIGHREHLESPVRMPGELD